MQVVAGAIVVAVRQRRGAGDVGTCGVALGVVVGPALVVVDVRPIGAVPAQGRALARALGQPPAGTCCTSALHSKASK